MNFQLVRGETFVVNGYVNEQETSVDILNLGSTSGVQRVAVAGPTATTAMSPNTLYVFGTTETPMTSLTVTFTAGNASMANSYHGIVYCGSDMAFNRPSGLIISENRELPTFGAGDIFEFNVVENILNFSYTEAM